MEASREDFKVAKSVIAPCRQGMCGIFLSVDCGPITDDILSILKRRGPSSYAEQVELLANHEIVLASSVLHLRGDQITKQPLSDHERFVLQWNGEVFDGLEISQHQSDTDVLYTRLHTVGDVVKVLGLIKGPFAFTVIDVPPYYLKWSNMIFRNRSIVFGLEEMFWGDGAF